MQGIRLVYDRTRSIQQIFIFMKTQTAQRNEPFPEESFHHVVKQILGHLSESEAEDEKMKIQQIVRSNQECFPYTKLGVAPIKEDRC